MQAFLNEHVAKNFMYIYTEKQPGPHRCFNAEIAMNIIFAQCV